ncbi:MAG: PTS sugar transporter subunit IIC [Syntrophotaleaceae bacterium]
MPFYAYLTAAGVALLCGLDRTAVGQFMLSRPIVAAPLTGLLLGYPLVGLQIGALLELLWVGRLPIGAAIPPDDTQVAVGCTVLATAAVSKTGIAMETAIVLSLLVGLPLGKSGEYFDRLARLWNARLLARAEFLLDAGHHRKAVRLHLLGLLHFGLASLATFAIIVGMGSLALEWFHENLPERFQEVARWLWLAFPLIGIAAILGTFRAPRAFLLFCCSFFIALLFL